MEHTHIPYFLEKFYMIKHPELIVEQNIGLKTLLQQGLSKPVFYGDFVYKMNEL